METFEQVMTRHQQGKYGVTESFYKNRDSYEKIPSKPQWVGGKEKELKEISPAAPWFIGQEKKTDSGKIRPYTEADAVAQRHADFLAGKSKPREGTLSMESKMDAIRDEGFVPGEKEVKTHQVPNTEQGLKNLEEVRDSMRRFAEEHGISPGDPAKIDSLIEAEKKSPGSLTDAEQKWVDDALNYRSQMRNNGSFDDHIGLRPMRDQGAMADIARAEEMLNTIKAGGTLDHAELARLNQILTPYVEGRRMSPPETWWYRGTMTARGKMRAHILDEDAFNVRQAIKQSPILDNPHQRISPEEERAWLRAIRDDAEDAERFKHALRQRILDPAWRTRLEKDLVGKDTSVLRTEEGRKAQGVEPFQQGVAKQMTKGPDGNLMEATDPKAVIEEIQFPKRTAQLGQLNHLDKVFPLRPPQLESRNMEDEETAQYAKDVQAYAQSMDGQIKAAEQNADKLTPEERQAILTNADPEATHRALVKLVGPMIGKGASYRFRQGLLRKEMDRRNSMINKLNLSVPLKSKVYRQGVERAATRGVKVKAQNAEWQYKNNPDMMQADAGKLLTAVMSKADTGGRSADLDNEISQMVGMARAMDPKAAQFVEQGVQDQVKTGDRSKIFAVAKYLNNWAGDGYKRTPVGDDVESPWMQSQKELKGGAHIPEREGSGSAARLPDAKPVKTVGQEGVRRAADPKKFVGQ